jgi:hypothetical protein
MSGIFTLFVFRGFIGNLSLLFIFVLSDSAIAPLIAIQWLVSHTKNILAHKKLPPEALSREKEGSTISNSSKIYSSYTNLKFNYVSISPLDRKLHRKIAT